MNLDILFAIIFYVALYGLFFLFRSKFHVQGRFFIMYKTKIGLKLMDRIARKDEKKYMPWLGIFIILIGIILGLITYLTGTIYPLGVGIVLILVGIIIAVPLRWTGLVSIGIGFLGMISMAVILVKGTIESWLVAGAAPTVAPVLPGIEIMPGFPVLGFWHWIIAILIMAVIHEFSHGIYARYHKVKIESSGFAFFGPLLAAFVEPDEKQMNRKKKRKQLDILSAGPFSNIYTALIFLVINVMIITPAAFAGLDVQGYTVSSIESDFPIIDSGLEPGMIITQIDGVDIVEINQLSSVIESASPGESIVLSNTNSRYPVGLGENVENSSQPHMGIQVTPYYGEDFGAGRQTLFWFKELFFWLYLISLGVGLFNLLPLGPVDGGRMFFIASKKIFKNEKRAKFVYKLVSSLILVVIVIALLPWLIGFIGSFF
jgi:membrane-associated protease RseP (regulator of RpoE activity)